MLIPARGWRPDRDPYVRLLRWWRADAAENGLSGSSIVKLVDLSAERAHLDSTIGGNWPALSANAAPNGRPAARFNGTNQVIYNLRPPLYSAIAGYTIFWAGNITAAANGRVIMEGSTSSGTPLFSPMSTSSGGTQHQAVARNDANTVYFNGTLGASTISGAANILAATDDLTTLTGYLNAAAQTTPLTSTRSATTLDNFALGGWNSASALLQPLPNDLFECFIVAGALNPNSAYFRNAHRYLRTGWGTA